MIKYFYVGSVEYKESFFSVGRKVYTVTLVEYILLISYYTQILCV